MAEKIIIASLDLDVKGVISSTQQLKQQLEQLKREQIALKNTGQESSQAFIENDVNIKLLSKAYNDNMKSLVANKTAMEDSANASEMLAIALEGEVRTIAEAREQNKLLNKLRNETNATTTEGQEQIRLLNNALNANNDFIKDNADAYLQQKINIGNYKDSITEALGELNLFNGGLAGFMQRAQASGGAGNLLKESLSGATSGMMGMVKASLVFIATPIGAIIAALVLAFALVKNAMDRSEESTQKITKIFTIFSGIVGRLLKFLEPLGEFLIDGIVLGFELAGKAAEKALDIISSGLEFLGFDDASKSVKGFKDEMVNASKEASKLADAEAQLEKAQRLAQKTQLDYQKQAEKLRQLRDDESKTIAERIKANDELGEVLKKQLAEELKIAELALIVANARIKAEGQTKDTLDAQAEALTTISDIQERITGQESEQLANLNSLRKEANDKAKEQAEKRAEAENKRIDNLINKSRQEIDLFVAQQGFKKKSTEEEYNFNKQIFDKELKDLELRYSKGKVSKLEYETEKLNLSNDFAKQNADLIIQNAEHEVNLIKDKNQKILDEDLFLSDEILKNKKKSIDDIAKAEREGLWLKKQLGLIIEQEYQDGLILIKQNADQKKTELDVTKDTQERERKAIDLENKRANDQLTFEQDVELQREQNAIKLEEELLNAENSGANKKLIEDKYANLDKQLTQSVQDFKLQSLSNTFGQISNLFGQQSKIGKAFALYQAGIDGYQSVLKAFNSQFIAGDPSSLPRAIGAGALAGAFAVKQIAGIAGAKFEKGGIQEIGGKRHSAGGTKFIGSDGTTFEAEAGEGIGILNRSAFSTFMDFNNRFGSGTSSNGFFQGGGIITQGIKNESINLDSVVNAIAQIPPPIVAVEEIQSVGNRFVSVQQTANL